ncbi:MAG TPA: thiamine pyrophosphate-dependent dehydrogenase E1 component subunit alpha [Mycobacteriales bacterium]|jgi:pyruvate dehydrogenase E1 component alpha subunit
MQSNPGRDEGLKRLFATMYTIRLFEEEVARLRATGDIVGSVHLCNGQEAIYAGACAALDLTRDIVFPTYRGHGWTIACGAPLEDMFAELLGRESGLNGGRGGSAYLSAPRWGMYGENSIVGAAAPIATGAALAATFDNSGRVSVAAFGDGALNQGAVHEAMNFASIRHLPVIFLVENNLYSELTVTSTMVSSDRLFKRSSAYGFPGVRIDGNDVGGVRATVAEAARRARAGEGPVLIEAMTERLVGHYIGDAEQYREAGELDRAREKEPLVRCARALADEGVTSDELDALKAQVQHDVDEASRRALASPLARPETVLEHLYA